MLNGMDEATKRRLIYVKKLYLHGHEHLLYGTEFDRMIALHHFDNAIELLLKCVATEYKNTFKNPLFITFDDLWKKVNKTYKEKHKSDLPKETEIYQLHELRNDVQHLGVSSFSTEVTHRFDIYVTDFIREIMKQVFKLKFEELFMSSLVENKTQRKILTAAEKAFEKRDYAKCVGFADAAFERAVRLKGKRSRFDLRATEDSLEEIAGIVFILALGVDYLKYIKYQKIAPGARWDAHEETIYYPPSLLTVFGEEEERQYSREDSLFVLNFVLDCILRWHL